jgi:cytochrome c-type biogenesis protein CcmH/NrfF
MLVLADSNGRTETVREMSAALQTGNTDDMVLDSFVKEYGTSVLVKPPAIDKLVWLVALVAVIAIVSFVVAFVRKRRPLN